MESKEPKAISRHGLRACNLEIQGLEGVEAQLEVVLNQWVVMGFPVSVVKYSANYGSVESYVSARSVASDFSCAVLVW